MRSEFCLLQTYTIDVRHGDGEGRTKTKTCRSLEMQKASELEIRNPAALQYWSNKSALIVMDPERFQESMVIQMHMSLIPNAALGPHCLFACPLRDYSTYAEIIEIVFIFG